MNRGNTKHGLCERHPTYNTWRDIKKRCFNMNCSAYPNYGGRGITVCEEWQNDFQSFYNWSMSHGWGQGLTLDRIDNNGNYCPTNCRWTSRTVQNNNKRNNTILEYNGKSLTVTQWAELLNISSKTLRWRVNQGWSVEKILITPVRKKGLKNI